VSNTIFELKAILDKKWNLMSQQESFQAFLWSQHIILPCITTL
jgi:hypothetical protein